jgi:hypothetical protein
MNKRFVVESVMLGDTQAWFVLDKETNQAVDMPDTDKEWIHHRAYNRNARKNNWRYEITVRRFSGFTRWGVRNRMNGVENSRPYSRSYDALLAEINKMNGVEDES